RQNNGTSLVNNGMLFNLKYESKEQQERKEEKKGEEINEKNIWKQKMKIKKKFFCKNYPTLMIGPVNGHSKYILNDLKTIFSTTQQQENLPMVKKKKIYKSILSSLTIVVKNRQDYLEVTSSKLRTSRYIDISQNCRKSQATRIIKPKSEKFFLLVKLIFILIKNFFYSSWIFVILLVLCGF
ncbi:hypothetical protein RFI_36569, partial [Reticulomyxa filosa]